MKDLVKKKANLLWILFFSLFFMVHSTNAKVIQTDLNSDWTFSGNDSLKNLSAKVPGTIHTDLLRHGIIKDPFYRVNERNQQWIGKKDWIYKTQFNVDEQVLNKQNINLVFKGLDTFADVYLNDSLILSADNMHRTWRVDVQDILNKKNNNMRIYFHSAFQKGKKLKEEAPIPFFQYPNNDQADVKVSTLVRKAGYHFGWDWGPRFVTCGIWRDVMIKAWDNSKLEGMQIITENIEENKAEMKSVVEISSDKKINNAKLSLTFGEQTVVDKTLDLEKGTNEFVNNFEVSDPQLWWSNGLGDQHLYDVSTELIRDDKVVDKKETRTGIRTINVVREKDKYGKSFYIELNGTPVFMKGANYIPNDNFLPRVPDKKYKHILQSAADANMNMIRVWGGGVFEKDLFYELSDELGLLVWQDMLFACGTYPGYDSFLNNVEEEVKDNVKRIRNHPSVALYCGNNEVELAYYNWTWQDKLNKEDQKVQEKYMEKLYYETIPEAISQVDTTRYYHPTSPNTGYNGISHLKGDMHDWSVWHGKQPFETYNDKVPRFMSEYGFQSYPELSTVKTFTKPEDRNLNSKVMKAHQRCMSDNRQDKEYGNRLIKHYMDMYYKEPKNFESYLYVSQLVQAKGVQMAVEAHRRSKPLNMGTLYWQLNDTWPVASWSSIDYEGNWKALHYTIRDMYKEFLVSPIVEEDSFRVYIVSDRLEDTEAKLNISLMNLSGEETFFSESKEVDIKANKSEIFFDKEMPDFIEGIDTTNLVCKVELTSGDDILASNIHHFVPDKKLQLSKPNIETKVQKSEDDYKITLTAENMAKKVFIKSSELEGFFSDNYFDMLPGETKVVKFTPDENEMDTETSFEVMSLIDTY